MSNIGADALWTGQTIAKGLNITHSLSDFDATGISIDTRSLIPGQIFIAIKGEKFDGNTFVLEAIERGAVAVIASDPTINLDDVSVPFLMVDDTLEALAKLADFHRCRFQGTVIGVTGSVGKTSIKNMLVAALENQVRVYATRGNFNNHIGLPLCMVNMPLDVSVAVFEMGMNHAGEIEPLSHIARPDVAIITTIEPVHIEYFDSIESIADAKAEICAGFHEDSLLILNKDNAYYDYLCSAVQRYNVSTDSIASFGDGGDAYMIRYEYDDRQSHVDAQIDKKNIHFDIGAPGMHMAKNAIAVLLAVARLGYSVDKAAESFVNYSTTDGRGKIVDIILPGNRSITVIDDSYNASVASITAALELLNQMSRQSSRRKVAVLGDMFECGDHASSLHTSLIRIIAEQQVDVVCTAGQNMAEIFKQLPLSIQGASCMDSIELSQVVDSVLHDGDIVLVKGSRGMQMDRIVHCLIKQEEEIKDRAL